MDINWENIQTGLTGNSVPEIVLAAAGAIALIIVIAYMKDKDSVLYKLMVLIGVAVGAVLVVINIDTYGQWALSTSVIAIIMGFALVIRPFRDVQIAAIVSLLAMALVYLLLGNLAGGSWSVLAEPQPRIIITFVAGALVFMAAHFVESVVMLFAKLFNAWPLLLILGLVCIVEAACVFMGYGSVYDLIMNNKDNVSSMFPGVVVKL